MSERDEGLRAVLAAHGPSGSVNSREGWVECECGERLHLASGFTFDGYPEMWEEERLARDAHLADAITAHLGATLAGLREAAVKAIDARYESDPEPVHTDDVADAVLAVVRDALGVRDE